MSKLIIFKKHLIQLLKDQVKVHFKRLLEDLL
jgi:hypothetical protein